MRNFIPSLIGRLKTGIQKGISAYCKTISENDPNTTLYIFGWLGNVAGGLWNGAKGAIGGFFGGGGSVTVGGPAPSPGVGITPPPPAPTPEPSAKPNILLYAGIAVGIIIFFVIIMMLFKQK